MSPSWSDMSHGGFGWGFFPSVILNTHYISIKFICYLHIATYAWKTWNITLFSVGMHLLHFPWCVFFLVFIVTIGASSVAIQHEQDSHALMYRETEKETKGSASRVDFNWALALFRRFLWRLIRWGHDDDNNNNNLPHVVKNDDRKHAAADPISVIFAAQATLSRPACWCWPGRRPWNNSENANTRSWTTAPPALRRAIIVSVKRARGKTPVGTPGRCRLPVCRHLWAPLTLFFSSFFFHWKRICIFNPFSSPSDSVVFSPSYVSHTLVYVLT